MATKEQEGEFREVAGIMGSLKNFGTVGEALRIMENVWDRRDEIEAAAEKWDIAACFGILGTKILLM